MKLTLLQVFAIFTRAVMLMNTRMNLTLFSVRVEVIGNQKTEQILILSGWKGLRDF